VKRMLRLYPKVNAPVLGLDVHKKLTVFCLLDAAGDIAREGQVATEPLALAKLFDATLDDRAHVALEACGLSLWIYDVLVGRLGADRVHLAQPAAVLPIAESKHKNDRNDAWWLAFLAFDGRLPVAYVPPAAYREVRTAARERLEAVRMRVRAIVRLKAELAQMGEVLKVQSLESPRLREQIEAIIERTTGMRREKLARCLETYDRFTEQRDFWADKLEELASTLPGVKELQEEIPGVGKTLAPTILAETGPVERFESAKALGGFTGFAPSDRSTGGRQIHGHMSREGSPVLRWALIEAVTHCSRSTEGTHGAVARWVSAKARRIGRGKARVAAARKLAEAIWRLFKLGECFDFAKAFGGLPPPASAVPPA
jgi:transposase